MLYMIFKKNELKLLSPFYLYQFIVGLSSMIFPFLVIYFKDLNLSFFQISVLFTSLSISMFIFEIPTGAFADGFSRKYSVVLGFFIAGFAIIGISFALNFWIILLLFITIGFGMTLVSGAVESWVIDNLNYYKRKDLHKEFFIKMQSIGAFAGIISPLIGALIVKTYSIKPLWFVWGTGFLIGGITLLVSSSEKYKPIKMNFMKTIQKTIDNTKKGIKFSKTHKTTRYLILASIFLAMMTVDKDFWQPFLTDLNMPIHQLGVIFSIVSAISMIVPFTARYLEKYKVKNTIIIIIIFRIILFGFILFLYPGLFIIGAGMFIFSEGILSLRFPVVEPYYHKHLPKKIRATITSIKNMGIQLGLAVGLLIFGYLADIIKIQYTIPLTGAFGLVAIYFFSKIKD